MQPLRKSILAYCVLIAVLALDGCQKSGDSSQPTAALSESGGDKDKSSTASGAESQPVKPAPDLLHPTYAFETSQGRFLVRLDAEKAPLTVDNFRNYVSRGFYDLTIFHQVRKDPPQIVLGGGYTADLKEKTSLTPIRNEAHNGLKNRRGTIAMARRANDEDSATCQFFINTADNNALDFKTRRFDAPNPESYGYCVFGEVTEGMDVVDRIAKAPVHDADKFLAVPVEAIVINSVRQVR